MPWYKKLHWQIISGLVLGVIYGLIAAAAGWGAFTDDWISPFGTIFINALQLIAVPLVVGSLITGVASLGDLSSCRVSAARPSASTSVRPRSPSPSGFSSSTSCVRESGCRRRRALQLQEQFAADVSVREEQATTVEERGPLQILVDIVPSNFFSAASSNRNMLQIVFVSLILGIGLLQLTKEKAQPLLSFFESLTELVVRLVDLIMLMAPLGVFALIARTITGLAGDDFGQILGPARGPRLLLFSPWSRAWRRTPCSPTWGCSSS